MGQYYSALTIDKKGRTKSFRQVGSLKLMEHSWMLNDFTNAVMKDIHGNPKRVAWIGDYANEESDEFGGMSHDVYMLFYDIAWQEKSSAGHRVCESSWTKIGKTGKTPAWCPGEEEIKELTKGTYLVNHSKKLYLDMDAYKKECTRKGWCVHPLPLLTACGNGRGGGDYPEEAPCGEYVGEWAFDTIELCDSKPEGDGYEEDEYAFIY